MKQLLLFFYVKRAKLRFTLLCSVLLFGSGAISAQAPRECTMTLTTTASNSTVCYGDSTKLTATPSGGTAPYTYSWAPSTGLVCDSCKKTEAGVSTNTTYTITVTDKTGCTATASVSVDVYPRIGIIAAYGDLYVCSGDSIQLSVGTPLGGTLPYTYSWTPDSLLYTPTVKNPYYLAGSSQTFTCKVTDLNGCSAKNSVHVVALSTPVFNASTNLARFLSGDSMHATGGGGGPYTYTWSPSISLSSIMALPTTTTTYTLSVTGENGCTGSSTATYTPLTSTLLGCGSIFMSEYIQDTAHHNDCIELYNPTASPINLSAYYLFGTSDGSLFAPPFYIRLHGTIRAHKTFLIANTYADTALTNHATMLSDSLNFGGSDIVALANMIVSSTSVNVTLLDEIGTVSPLPTDSGWAVGTGSTKNHTLLRKPTVTVGDINWTTCQTEWNVYPRGSFRSIGNYKNICTPTDPDITFSFSNPTANCGGSPGYVNFSVEAQSTESTMFNSCVVDIAYSGLEFSGDSYSSGSILVTAGPDFQSASGNDYTSPTVTDVSPGVIEITIGDPSSSSPSGTEISTDTLTLFNISLQIQNSCQTGSIGFTTPVGGNSATFTEENSTSTPTYYCDGDISSPCYDPVADTCADGNPCSYSVVITYSDTTEQYNVDYSGGNLTPKCLPEITDFTSSNTTGLSFIDAGIGDILTITGSGFGSTQGTGQVEFRDADSLNYYAQKMDASDYISWTDNQIQIKLPAFVDSVFANQRNTSIVGGGNFIVKNSCGDSAVSGNNSDGVPFSVYYNISQYWYYPPSYPSAPAFKTEMLLRSTDSSGGYVIRFDSVTFPKGSIQRLIFTKAMTEWTCYTGMNWIVGSDTSYTYRFGYFTPGLNYVFFTDSLLNRTTVAETNPNPNECSSDSIDIVSEGVIYFNSYWQPKFVYDTTETDTIKNGQADFYGVCLHELGHFIELNHSTDPTSLMYYTANTNFILPTHRINLSKPTAAAAVDGGIYSVQQSVTIPGGCDGLSPMTGKNTFCKNTTSISQVQQSNTNTFSIYPNPSHGTFTIETTVNNYTLVITNMLGQRILCQKIQHSTSVIDIFNQANGMYFIQEQYQNGIATQKLIITK